MSSYARAYELKDEIISCRRYIHSYAEVGFDLPRTRKFIMDKLTKYGYEPKQLGDGVVATVGSSGKVIMLRADMDGLPFKEQSGLEFASTSENCHACGHDIHTSMLLGAAKMLKEREKELKGTVKLLFQPAEELLIGAETMVDAGVLENPKVDCAVMCHVNSVAGGAYIGIGIGPKQASSNNFKIRVKGKGSHGALPCNGVDPVMIGAHILVGVQELITRELPFDKSATITMGHFEAGSAANVIPPEAFIEGTMRTFTLSTQEYLKKRLPEVVSAIAKLYRGEAELEFTCDVPVNVNDPVFGADIERYLKEMAAENGMEVRQTQPSPGSEDFAFYSRVVPGYVISLNMPNPGAETVYPLHNPHVVFDENIMPVGSAAFVECAVRWLDENA